MLADRDKCTGCSACFCACENDAIVMKADNAGFKYPYIDSGRCVQCLKCETACPVLNPAKPEDDIQTGYILQNIDKDKLYESTSGAVFPEIAEYVLRKGGKVYGAAFGEDFIVRHVGIEDKNDLGTLKKSKYVQSDLQDIFREIRRELENGKYVCFSGTPCQVEGLSVFLGKEFPALVTVDVVCHGVGSPKLWEKYIEFKEKNGKISDVCFRDKSKGYQYSQMRITYEDGSQYLQGTEYDQMLRAFFSNICDRKSCYSCSFKKSRRVSDFTIWDSFDNRSFGVDLDENIGTSKMIIHSEKGRHIFDEIKTAFSYRKVDVSRLIDSSYEMTHSISENAGRRRFLFDLNQMPIEELFGKYFPTDPRVMVTKTVRELLYRLGLYSAVRRMLNRIKQSLK